MQQGVMHKLYMIYWPWEAQKNQGFIQMFQEKGVSLGWDTEYVSIEEYQEKELPDCVVNRTRCAQVSQYYQSKGVTVMHAAELVEIANDKYRTIRYLEKYLPETVRQKKWCPKSRTLKAEESQELWCRIQHSSEQHSSVLDNDIERELDQWVIKSLDGHGGSEVYLLSSPQWGDKLLGRKVLLQERIHSESQDLRVYIVGGSIYRCILRQGAQDFRSNFSLGGRVSEYLLSHAERSYVQQFIDSFPENMLAMCGMDFIRMPDGKLVFNEVEEMVGSRMLYQCTSCDIVKDYLIWLKTFVEKSDCISKGL